MEDPMRANEVVVTWAFMSTFLLMGIVVHDCAGAGDLRRQTESTQACEQRALDGEKARKQAKDEKECREIARDSYALLGSEYNDQKYITAFQVSYEKCMEVRGSKP